MMSPELIILIVLALGGLGVWQHKTGTPWEAFVSFWSIVFTSIIIVLAITLVSFLNRGGRKL